MKPTYRKSWAWNFLMLDLTFGPSFKVKRWFTGFGELSFRWIQISISSPMRRSSFHLKTDSRHTKQKMQKTIIINLRHSRSQSHGEKLEKAEIKVDMLVQRDRF